VSKQVALFGLALAMVAMIGCAGSAPRETEESVEVSLTPVTFEQWQQELAALEGRIVVVDMWATWCVPCVERFPKMVELFHEYSPRGVTFVSMCLDDREDADAIAFAREFLDKQKAVFANFLMDEIVSSWICSVYRRSMSTPPTASAGIGLPLMILTISSPTRMSRTPSRSSWPQALYSLKRIAAPRVTPSVLTLSSSSKARAR
jgi:thiol-disulfide isomerase/thioredoxin